MGEPPLSETRTDGSDAARVLVVDDSAEIRKLVKRVAEQMGLTVDMTESARDVVAKVQEFRPDVILLDLSMPDMDGIEVLRALAQAGCKARIVLMTGFDLFYMEAARKIGEASGLNLAGTIAKPLRVAALKAALA